VLTCGFLESNADGVSSSVPVLSSMLFGCYSCFFLPYIAVLCGTLFGYMHGFMIVASVSDSKFSLLLLFPLQPQTQGACEIHTGYDLKRSSDLTAFLNIYFTSHYINIWFCAVGGRLT